MDGLDGTRTRSRDGALKRVAIFQIRCERFSSLFFACLCPETGSHFRETWFRRVIGLLH
ncbi:hypothetical protein SAMN03080618_00665 [Aquamicrobium aerolatum DSM 21857]|uniref:Uncharacterized protein n=1 Tax=Aquamicrobium aerolatum DSM 21857 TaxID=1121003 RepID=A0A1I3IV13_9HYPH|nr:hypothetical protein SAMN03080618_00665 [Aquamicrobium aerolatum DSM 21857]